VPPVKSEVLSAFGTSVMSPYLSRDKYTPSQREQRQFHKYVNSCFEQAVDKKKYIF
jgi:hypothetical protein